MWISRRRDPDMETFFATCPRGLEGVLAEELTALGAQEVRPVDGGVGFRGPYVLSYRINLGWERVESEGEDGGPDQTLEGLAFDQDLTYDLFASPATRFWIGPELRLGFFDGSFDNAGGDRNYFAAGIGPVLGFDLALNPSVALSWKLGYLFTWYYPEEDPWGNDYYYPGYHDSYSENDAIDEGHAYMSLTVLFRLWGAPPPGPPPAMYQPQGRW
jgi:hypothetical protein